MEPDCGLFSGLFSHGQYEMAAAAEPRQIYSPLLILKWFRVGYTAGASSPGCLRAKTEKARGMSPAPQCYLYIQTSILEGVNPPNFEIYVCRGMSGLRGIGWFWGLDNFSAERRVLSKNPWADGRRLPNSKKIGTSRPTGPKSDSFILLCCGAHAAITACREFARVILKANVLVALP